MTRWLFVTLLVNPAAPALASHEGDGRLAAPSKAVAEAWAREARAAEARAAATRSNALTLLHISYAGLQTADMWSTIAARNNGAREVNPLMAGSYTKGIAVKAAMGATTILATRAMAKKHKKGAAVMMVVLNAVTAAVVANNMRHVRR